MLLIGAGLFVRTMRNFQNVVADYDPGHLLQIDMEPGLAKYDPERLRPVLEQMIAGIESIPGVQSASISCCGNNVLSFGNKDTGRRFGGRILYVRENFFETMGVPLLFGRSFTAADTKGASPVVMVNEAFVHNFFRDTTPLGKTMNGSEIIGVVRDAKLGRLRQEPGPAIYWPYRQAGYGRMTFRIRTQVDPTPLIPAIRESLQQVDSRLPISNVRTLAQQFDRTLAQENMFAGLSTLFGILALVLTCVGFYGIMAYSVARRTNEMGGRMALGAHRLDVVRLVMSEGLFRVIVGVGLGVAGALASTRYIESILFGLAPDDGMTILSAVVVMIGVAVAAAFVPARRAARIDPLVALRYE